MTTILLILHFTGLTMGFSATFASMVTMRQIGSATPQEVEVLRTVQTRMLRLSSWGVLLLLVTGPVDAPTRSIPRARSGSVMPGGRCLGLGRITRTGR